MSAYADYPSDATALRRGNWFTRAEDWLDSKGRGAWIAAMILGFIAFWPVGLALLAYVIWSKRMFKGCAHSRHMARHGQHSHHYAARRMGGLTGNSAFDAYKADTLARLEREQEEFESFLARLRKIARAPLPKRMTRVRQSPIRMIGAASTKALSG